MGNNVEEIKVIIKKLECKIQEIEVDFSQLWMDMEEGVIDVNQLATGREYLNGRKIVLQSVIRRWERELDGLGTSSIGK